MKKFFVGCVGVGADLTIIYGLSASRYHAGSLEQQSNRDAQIIKERKGNGAVRFVESGSRHDGSEGEDGSCPLLALQGEQWEVS